MSTCEIWADGNTIFGAFAAAAAAAAYLVYTAVTMGNGPLMGGRRRRRRNTSNDKNHLADALFSGNELNFLCFRRTVRYHFYCFLSDFISKNLNPSAK